MIAARTRAAVGSALAALALLAFAVPGAVADDAAPVYDPGSVGVIDVQLPPAAVAAL